MNPLEPVKSVWRLFQAQGLGKPDYQFTLEGDLHRATVSCLIIDLSGLLFVGARSSLRLN